MALYLRLLMVNKDAYEEHLAWKQIGMGNYFKNILENNFEYQGACNLCKAVAYIKKFE